MSTEQTKIIDAIGIDNVTDNVILTISDQIDWSEQTDNHLFLLQEKINSYLSFIESGEMIEVYPDAKNRKAVINVIYKYPLNKQAQEFYQKVEKIIENAGIGFKYKSLNV
ncbi:MAG: hypothetical protein LBI78_05880 [Campylobacteraceae bacterium]|jgi:hypothetical protein|nr:hypothetical protein [Campylobacteraceae bacterium]